MCRGGRRRPPPARSAGEWTTGARSLPIAARTDTPAIPFCRCRLRRDARAYSPSDYGTGRAGTPSAVMQFLEQRTAHALLPERRPRDLHQGELFSKERRRAFWQSRFYELQCLEHEEAGREAAVHASQYRETRTGGVARAMALEQLSPLFAGETGFGARSMWDGERFRFEIRWRERDNVKILCCREPDTRPSQLSQERHPACRCVRRWKSPGHPP
jgi:hypothetical protein